jgi:formylmethanofuran dehydrogenase subunit C
MIHLKLHTIPDVPLEVDGLLPERLLNVSPNDIAQLPVHLGNRKCRVGDFFLVEGTAADGILKVSAEGKRIKRLGERMTCGTIIVDGDIGMHTGAMMSGGRIEIHGPTGDWLGAEMTGGEVRVFGHAGSQVGGAYRGSRKGMRGGTICIDGNAGDEVGLLMRRGLIAIRGSVGEFAAASMIAGTIVVGGSIGRGLGAGMKRGTVTALGPEPEFGPGHVPSCRYRPAYINVLERSLRSDGIDWKFPLGDYRCWRGDRASNGLGEILSPVDVRL